MMASHRLLHLSALTLVACLLLLSGPAVGASSPQTAAPAYPFNSPPWFSPDVTSAGTVWRNSGAVASAWPALAEENEEDGESRSFAATPADWPPANNGATGSSAKPKLNGSSVADSTLFCATVDNVTYAGEVPFVASDAGAGPVLGFSAATFPDRCGDVSFTQISGSTVDAGRGSSSGLLGDGGEVDGISVSFWMRSNATSTSELLLLTTDIVVDSAVGTFPVAHDVRAALAGYFTSPSPPEAEGGKVVLDGAWRKATSETPAAVYFFAYFDVPTATLAVGSAGASNSSQLTVLLYPNQTSLRDGSWHSVALVLSKAAEDFSVVQLFIDAETDYVGDDNFACVKDTAEFVAPVESDPGARLNITVAGWNGLVIETGGALVLAPGQAAPANGTTSTFAPPPPTMMGNGGPELFSVRFFSKALTQSELYRNGAPAMRDALKVTPLMALIIGGVMGFGAIIVIFLTIHQVFCGELASAEATLTRDDFTELETGNVNAAAAAGAVAPRVLNAGVARRVVSAAKASQFAAKFTVAKQIAAVLPPLLDVLQTQALLLRGFRFAWPVSFRIPMEFITVPFALNFDLPTFNVEIPSYAPMLVLLVVALMCLGLGLFFGAQDARDFKVLLHALRLADRASMSLALTLLTESMPPDKAVPLKQRQQWALAITQNGWALDASALELLLPGISPAQARATASILGSRPADAIEAELRRFTVEQKLKNSDRTAIAFATALATAAPGTDITTVATKCGYRLSEEQAGRLLEVLRKRLHVQQQTPSKKEGKRKKGRVATAAAALGGAEVSSPTGSAQLDSALCHRIREASGADAISVDENQGSIDDAGVGKIFDITMKKEGGSTEVLYVCGRNGVEAQQRREFVRLLEFYVAHGIGWQAPAITVSKSKKSSSGASRTLRDISVARIAPRTYRATATDSATGQRTHFHLYVTWASKLTCPYHNTQLIVASEKHYKATTSDGSSVFRCVVSAMRLFKESAQLEPCRSDKQYVCPKSTGSKACRYTVCGTCSKSVMTPWKSRAIGFGTQWHEFKSNPTAAIALLSFLGLQFVYLPATEDSLMLLGCHPTLRCEFPKCYSTIGSNPKFMISVIVAGTMFAALTIGVPLYWLIAINTRRKKLARVIHTPAQWDELMARDTTILSNLYNKYEQKYMILEPAMLVLKNVALVASVAFTEPESLWQLVAVALVTVINALFLSITSPFLDPWIDVLTKADMAHNGLQLAMLSVHKAITVDNPSDETMVAPMYAVVVAFMVVYGLVFFKTVVRSWREATISERADELNRRELTWLDVTDPEKRRVNFEVILKRKKAIYGKKHFQYALTLAHIAAATVNINEQQATARKCCAVLTKVLKRESKRLAKGAEDSSPLASYSFGGRGFSDLHPQSWTALIQALVNAGSSSEEYKALKVVLGEMAHRSQAVGKTEIGPVNAVSLQLAANASSAMTFSDDNGTATDLRKAFLSSAGFTGVYLRDSSFQAAELSYADFSASSCTRVDFEGAELQGCRFGLQQEKQFPQFHVDFSTANDAFVAVGPRGDLAVVYGMDQHARVVDAHTGRTVGQLSAHRKRVTSAAFSPDALLIATGDEGGDIVVWDALRMRKRTAEAITVKRKEEIAHLEFSPTGDVLAVGTDDCYTLYDTSHNAKAVKALPKGKVPHDWATLKKQFMFPDGLRYVIIDSSDDFIQIKPLPHLTKSDGTVPKEGPQIKWSSEAGANSNINSSIEYAGCSGSGRILMINTESSTTKIIDGQTGRVVTEIPVAGGSMDFTPDGHRIITIDEGGTCRTYDASTGALLDTQALAVGAPKSQPKVLRHVVSPDARYVYVTVDKKSLDPANSKNEVVRSLMKFDLQGGGARGASRRIMHEDTPSRIIALGETGRFVSSGGGTARVWEAATGRLMRVIDLPERSVDHIVVDPSAGSWFAIHVEKRIIFYSCGPEDAHKAAGERGVLAEFTTPVQWPDSMAITADGKHLVVINTENDDAAGMVIAVPDVVRTRSVPPGQVIQAPVNVTAELKFPGKTVFKQNDESAENAVCLSNERIITSHFEGGVFAWDMTSGKFVSKVRHRINEDAGAALLASAGPHLFASRADTGRNDDGVDVYSTSHLGFLFSVSFENPRTIACSASGTRLVASNRSTIRAWDLTNSGVRGTYIFNLETSKGTAAVSGISGRPTAGAAGFTPDGKYLAFGSNAPSSISFWDMNPDQTSRAVKTTNPDAVGFSALNSTAGDWLVRGASTGKLLLHRPNGSVDDVTHDGVLSKFVGSTEYYPIFRDCIIDKAALSNLMKHLIATAAAGFEPLVPSQKHNVGKAEDVTDSDDDGDDGWGTDDDDDAMSSLPDDSDGSSSDDDDEDGDDWDFDLDDEKLDGVLDGSIDLDDLDLGGSEPSDEMSELSSATNSDEKPKKGGGLGHTVVGVKDAIGDLADDLAAPLLRMTNSTSSAVKPARSLSDSFDL